MPTLKEIRSANSVADIKALFSKKPAIDITDTVERAPENFIFVPSLPETNLLPGEFVERQAVAALVRKFIIIGVAVAVLFVAAGGAAFGLNLLHQQQLTAINQQNQSLNSQLAALGSYATSKQNLESARQSVSSTLSKDVDVASILGSMNSVANQYGVSYSTLSMSISASSTAASGSSSGGSSGCFNPDPYNPSTSIGCITVGGTAGSQSDATNFFKKFNNTKGFENGFISTLSTTAGKVSFQGTVAFDSAFYSQKYAGFATSVDQLIQQAGTNTTTTTSESDLRTKFPTVFASASNATIANMITQVCTAAGAGNATSASLTARLSVVLGTSVSQANLSPNATAIITDVIGSNCESDLSKVNFGSGSDSTGTSTSGPTPSQSASTPASSSAATGATNG